MRKVAAGLLILVGGYAGEEGLGALYRNLDPHSVAEHLAFYELYPQAEEGQRALSRAWELLNHAKVPLPAEGMTLPPSDIQAVVSLVTRQAFDPPVKLTVQQLELVEAMGKSLANRRLKGFTIWTKEELLALPSEEVDLGRGLLLNQFSEPDEIRQYEASLDLMALQIAARLPENASAKEKINAINRFIFYEMQFRFPPHSLYARDIDLYTFLPSVLDSRKGVCLGVSILYLSLAQRLDLPLEIITPPGHIYVRYRSDTELINIETTARGINTPSEGYLSIHTYQLQQRSLKEVIGLAFVNQASVAWSRGDHAQTVSLYEKALPYLSEDPLLKMFLGFNYLFVGKKSQGTKLLEQVRSRTFDGAVAPDTVPEDFLKGEVDAEGIKAIFLPVDETRDSILEKQRKLQKIVARYPRFRAGLLQLAITWLQLERSNEALEVLLHHHQIDSKNPIVEYYLAMLCIQRLDYNRAWEFLKTTEAILSSKNHHPRALRQVREHLRRLSPL